MRLFLLFLFLLLTCWNTHAENQLSTQYSRHTLEESIVRPGEFSPVPKASSSFWKGHIGFWIRNSYINNGKEYLGKPWVPIPTKVFREFTENGNRSHYEQLSFNLRKQLSCMVMAEIMQDSGLFINDIIAGLHYFKREVWWGIPAHYPKPEPHPAIQEVDLFNAETANLLVWTCYMLEDRIKTIDRTICRDIKNEVKRRILIPARTTNYIWKRRSWNHNPWTCANWLSCILFCEDNRTQQIDDICQVLESLDIFIDGYPEDGGCDEGPHYWDRAMGSLFECMQLLSLASDGKVVLPKTNKIKAMAAYIYKMYIGGGYYVNFADCQTKMLPNINILYPLGLYLGDKSLTRFAAFIGQQYQYLAHPRTLYNRSGNYPTLSRELCFLRYIKTFIKEKATEPHTAYTWLPESEIFTSHNTSGLFVAAKGGHNDESHNHNDVGNFMVFADGTPLFIDLGSNTYTAKTFSKDRYELMNTRSSYHNVPLINGKEQHAGRDFKSKNVRCSIKKKEKVFSIDLAAAYPPNAYVNKWERTIRQDKQSVTITENLILDKVTQPTEIVLISTYKPELRSPGRLSFNLPTGDYELQFPSKKLQFNIESFDISNTGMRATWGNIVYRTKFTIRSSKKKQVISYSIYRRN